MIGLIKLFGIVILLFGVFFILKPAMLKKWMAFWVKGKSLYAAAFIGFLFGIVFLLAAFRCRAPWIIIIMGITGLVKTIFITAMSPKKVNSIINWWSERPVSTLRLLAIITLIMGALIVYAA